MLRVSEWGVFAIIFSFWIILCAAVGQEISGNFPGGTVKSGKFIQVENKTISALDCRR